MNCQRILFRGLIVFLLAGSPAFAADDEILVYAIADRFEYVSESSELVWDGQGWIGGDYNKLWLKIEGNDDHGELQALFSRAVSPFFDLQIGLRHDFDPRPSRTHAVIGVQGIAPYWFEIDAAAFISDEGDVSARFEVEYDLLLTQRLILQPRFELNAGFGSVDELGLGSGVRDTDLSLRLRYEVRRKIAPYIGVQWNKSYGDTADVRRIAQE